MAFSPEVKLWHYRLAIILLYNEEMPGVTRDGMNMSVDIKQLARWLGQRIPRIRACLGNMEYLAIISDLDMEEYSATFRLEIPYGLTTEKPKIL